VDNLKVIPFKQLKTLNGVDAIINLAGELFSAKH
jgi:hypothetical protein